MNISIIGGGNIGTLMAAEFANRGHKVLMYTSKTDKWNKEIRVFNAQDEHLFTGKLSIITDSMQEALRWSDIVFVTVPAHVFLDIAKKMYPYVERKYKIGVIPGSGGAEFAFRDIIKKGCVLFGVQRVHSIARLKEYGSAVYELGKKDNLLVASIPACEGEKICELVSRIFDMPCSALDNYMAVTLTPSNPILHTSRLYCMFKDCTLEDVCTENPMFYEEWDDESSRTLIACDSELQLLCDKIPLDLREVISLKRHYESENVKEMTEKLHSIKAFKGIKSPMIQIENGWRIDSKSRYFISDFPYGLKIIRDLARIYEVETPEIDKVYGWFEKLFIKENIKYFHTDMDKKEIEELYR